MSSSLSLNPLFGNHGVLPREVVLPISGRGVPGHVVKVTFAGQTVSTKVDAQGSWLAPLEPVTAAGPHTLVVSSTAGQLLRRNILVGDVWLVAGGRAVDLPVQSAGRAIDARERVGLAGVRVFRVARAGVLEPASECGGAWQECAGETLTATSALALRFAQALAPALERPLGIIQVSWPGTRITSWVPRDFLKGRPEFASGVELARRARRLVEPETAQGMVGVLEVTETQCPSALFNGMVAPLTVLPVNGVVWGQGLSDLGDGELHRAGLIALIRGWRAAWSQAGLPFLIAQSAGAPEGGGAGADEAWAALREAQALTVALPDTALTVTADLGSAAEAAAFDRARAAERLALAALATAYGRSMPAGAPKCAGHAVVGATVRLRFPRAGLRCRAGGAAWRLENRCVLANAVGDHAFIGHSRHISQ